MKTILEYYDQVENAEVVLTGNRERPILFNGYDDIRDYRHALTEKQLSICMEYAGKEESADTTGKWQVVSHFLEQMTRLFHETAENTILHHNLLIRSKHRIIDHRQVKPHLLKQIFTYIHAQHESVMTLLQFLQGRRGITPALFEWKAHPFQLLELADMVYAYVSPLLPDMSKRCWFQACFRFFNVKLPNHLYQQLAKLHNRSNPCRFIAECLRQYRLRIEREE